MGQNNVCHAAVGGCGVGLGKGFIDAVSGALDGGFLPAPDIVKGGQLILSRLVYRLLGRMKIPLYDGIGTFGCGVKLNIAADFMFRKGADPKIPAVTDGKVEFGMTWKIRLPHGGFIRVKFIRRTSGQQESGPPEQSMGGILRALSQI